MSNTPQTEQPSVTLPVLALVFCVLFFPIGVILSIVSIVKYGSANGSTAKTLSIIALVVNILIPIPLCGVCAAIAVPNFVKFQCRSKQSEAKGNLKALYVSEESFRAEHDRYDSDLAALQFTPRGERVRYVYTVLSATKEAFAAEARGTGDMQGDVWTISQANDLQHVDNSCD